MHVTEREEFILNLLLERKFISFRKIEGLMDASPATLRRDIKRLAQEGRLTRVRGGLQFLAGAKRQKTLQGSSFDDNVTLHYEQKRLIASVAASMCKQGEAIMIDGGSTTLQMCPFLENKNLQVLTNSLHIVNALLPQSGTRLTVPGGTVFPEQNIILAASGDDCIPSLYAPKLFMGAASVGSRGLMQADVLLVAAERKLIDRAEQVILLVDSSKFDGPSGNVVCQLNEIDIIITDKNIDRVNADMIKSAGIKLILAK